jgi:hypothetical protein
VPSASVRLVEVGENGENPAVAGVLAAEVQVVVADAAHLERVISTVRGLSYVQQTDTTLLLSPLIPRRMGGPVAAEG